MFEEDWKEKDKTTTKTPPISAPQFDDLQNKSQLLSSILPYPHSPAVLIYALKEMSFHSFVNNAIFFIADKLDGLSHGMHKREKQNSTTMEDYLQLSDDYYKRKSTPGKKMVRSLSVFVHICVSGNACVLFVTQNQYDKNRNAFLLVHEMVVGG